MNAAVRAAASPRRMIGLYLSIVLLKIVGVSGGCFTGVTENCERFCVHNMPITGVMPGVTENCERFCIHNMPIAGVIPTVNGHAFQLLNKVDNRCYNTLL